MGIEFSKGFFVFDKSWIHENKFVQSLSHADYRILIYLLSSTLKISKRNKDYKRGDLIASLYKKNKILFINITQRTIAEKCSVNRATVCKALKKFKDFGAIIKMPDSKENGANDYYIIGFENHRKDKDGKQEYYLVDSIPVRAGEKLPDSSKDFIRDHHKDDLFWASSLIWEDLFGMGRDTRGK
jgi:DNA-binding MarR family transcriptional regulator